MWKFFVDKRIAQLNMLSGVGMGKGGALMEPIKEANWMVYILIDPAG